MDKNSIIQQLELNKNLLFEKYPIKQIGLFGSFVRNEQSLKSDIDILVDFYSPVGFEFIDLGIELEEILHHKVDLVSKNGVKSSLLPFIENEIIYV